MSLTNLLLFLILITLATYNLYGHGKVLIRVVDKNFYAMGYLVITFGLVIFIFNSFIN
jgi:hypothetical protein